MATKPLENVAMDLKYYEGKIILHSINMCTKLSAAVTLCNKHPDAVIKALFRIWIFIFNATETFFVYNVVELANENLINLGEKFGISVKTGESPWSNGVVERHNSKPCSMLDKALINGKCDFDLALNWSINAKNCLANIHGFTLNQFGTGTNPRLAYALHDTMPALTVEAKTQTIADNLSVLHKAREAFI